MINLLKTAVVLLSLAMGAGAHAAGEHAHTHTGKFVTLDPVVPPLADNKARHEVVELFWYGCSHCYDFEPYINAWKQEKADDVEFVRVPAVLNARWEQHARAFYALEIMDELEKGHQLLFNGIHEQGRRLNDLDSMARFLAANGIDESKFRESFKSFAVETKVNRAKQLMRQYQATGVPTVIVNGKYKTSASQAGGYSQLISAVEALTGPQEN